MEQEETSYFKHVVLDAVHDLKKDGIGYCFNSDQVEAIQQRIDCVVYKVEDGIYYLREGDDPRK